MTVAPSIKQKRKLPSGNFETFKTSELISQIRTAIKPEKVDKVDMDSLVVEALADKLKDPNFNVREDDEGDNSSKADVEVKEGTVAVFENVESLGEEFLGVAISGSKVQPYKCSTRDFQKQG